MAGKIPETHDVMIYSQSPYATVAVDGKKIDGIHSVMFRAEAGRSCSVTLELMTNHVTIKGAAEVKGMDHVE